VQGYDESLGVTMHKAVPAIDFIKSSEPVQVLSQVHALTFEDEASKQLLDNKATTEEIKACCEDLRLLGRNDFKALLKWRMALVRAHQKALKDAKESDGEASEEEPRTAEQMEEEKQSKMQAALQELIGKELARKKRERKRLLRVPSPF
jgi:AdoMet-dependent rRNA methyltransferase SPB1